MEKNRNAEMENKETAMTETNNGVMKAEKPRRRLNPVVKWALISVGAAVVIGGVTYLIVKGKKVPVEAVEKAAEVAAEVAAA